MFHAQIQFLFDLNIQQNYSYNPVLRETRENNHAQTRALGQ
jgi:hypothetical protein